jgi:hypothetical protein
MVTQPDDCTTLRKKQGNNPCMEQKPLQRGVRRQALDIVGEPEAGYAANIFSRPHCRCSGVVT